ncbi:MAG: MIP/aquaporin family protein [Pseudomonadota bacterium]
MATHTMLSEHASEYIGTALLLMVVTGSGIMGEQLSPANAAIALLANSIATGCGLYVLITLLAPISGAHFNPLVSLYAWRMGFIDRKNLIAYCLAQFAGAISGVWLSHALFSLPVIQYSSKPRHGLSIWISELIASAVLLAVIHLGIKSNKEKLPMLVALTVTAGYWFTSSTFFANPAVTLARSLTDTFVGIAPADVIGFICAQIIALLLILIAIWKI